MKHYVFPILIACLLLASVFPVSASKRDQFIAAQALLIEQDARREFQQIHGKMKGDLQDYINRYSDRVHTFNLLVKDRQIREPEQIDRARRILRLLESR